jgi:hypothetical protein
MAMLGVISITLFVGITFLANGFGVVPAAEETVNSQLARRVFGDGSPLYYLVQAMTMLILVLAANTSFADFPRLSSFMARDRFMPRQFGNRGDRLAFSNGIIILAVLSAILLVIFRAETHALIPLYSVGVFVSFTLSQAGMVRHWRQVRGSRWLARAIMNGLGAVSTGIVTLVLATTKFTSGAWMVVLLIPCLVLIFLAVRRHYDDVAGQLSLEGVDQHELPPARHHVLLLVGDVHRGVLAAIRYARALSSNARAIYIETDPESRRRLEDRWTKWAAGMRVVVLRSPYRSVVGPLLEYLDSLQRETPDTLVTLVLPEFLPARWWQQLLHNQTALLIKGALLFRRGVIVVDVPYHLTAKAGAPEGEGRGAPILPQVPTPRASSPASHPSGDGSR